MHTDIDAAESTGSADPTDWQARCEAAEARNRVLEARFRYLRNAVVAVSDDDI